MDSLLVKVVLQFLYTVLTLFRGGVHTSPTSLHLALMRLFISVCNLSMVLDDLALNAKNPLHCCNGFL